jgi:aspartyl-tRNA(Asn)/glutamyl-tRNA(Gln) amidotransferase subunit B
VEANISLASRGPTLKSTGLRPDLMLGTKVEIKNLNSFRSVERSISYEIARQSSLMEKGEDIVQETRGWDESSQKTFSQRKKEKSHDYRYFPDPDLPKLILSEIPELKEKILWRELPELPQKRRGRYIKMGIKKEDADMFVRNTKYGGLFDSAIEGMPHTDKKISLSANYIANDLAGKGKMVSPKNFKKLIAMIDSHALSSRGAKEILSDMTSSDADPEIIAKEKNLMQKSGDKELIHMAKKIIEQNPKVVLEYMAGKKQSLQYLIGQGMKDSKGSANPQELGSAIQKILG